MTAWYSCVRRLLCVSLLEYVDHGRGLSVVTWSRLSISAVIAREQQFTHREGFDFDSTGWSDVYVICRSLAEIVAGGIAAPQV